MNFDDDIYVTENPHVRAGLTWEGVIWAFGRLHGEGTYWHPLTWASHMVDCQLFGLKAWGHHLVSLLFHLLNTMLVFGVLRQMTGAFWRCAAVAGLFALHPLQVDTVAWVAERKNLLAAFFWLLTMWAYSRYAQAEMQKAKCRVPTAASLPVVHKQRWYVLTLSFFALGLMCKPVLVTLPLVLLLLDYWPLHRCGSNAGTNSHNLSQLVREKLPLFIMAALSCMVTVLAHRSLGMLQPASGPSLELRIENAVVSYVRYLGNALWPSNLVVYCPFPRAWPLWTVAMCGLLLLAFSGFALRGARDRSYLLLGWLWFLGVLVPFIGLIQAGTQAMADRFAYVPLIGLFIALVWGSHELMARWRYGAVTLTAAASVALVVCGSLTRRQISYWRNEESLWLHTLTVTKNDDREGRNFGTAFFNLGMALTDRGAIDDAIECFRKAVRLNPDKGDAHRGLAYALLRKGKSAESVEEYELALRLNPNDSEAHNNLGNLYADRGDVPQAAQHAREAIRLKPNYAEAYFNLGNALNLQGKLAEAAAEYTRAAQLKPGYGEAHYNLGGAQLRLGNPNEAAAQFMQVVRLQPENATARSKLAFVLAQQGRTAEAISQYAEALRLQPDLVEALRNLSFIHATHPSARYRNGSEALRRSEQAVRLTQGQDAMALDALAAAYAELGQFPEASATARQAQAIAAAQGRAELAAQVQQRLNLYNSGQPYRQPPGPR